MATLEDLANANNMSDFVKALQENHLAQVMAAKYESNPLILGEHFTLNFTPLPPGPCGDDPAENSKVILVSFKPQYKSPIFGNIMIPENRKGNSVRNFRALKNFSFQTGHPNFRSYTKSRGGQ